MKMDGRDSAECQNWEKRDKIGIIDLSHKKTKMLQCYSPQIQKKQKRGGAEFLMQ